jgi:MYXO-CTERM domain-containing protein
VPNGAQLSSVFSVLAGSFTFRLTAWGTNPNSSGDISASLVNEALTVLQSLVLTVSGKTEKSVATGPFNLAAGAYKIMWTGTAVGTGAVKGTASLVGPSQTVAVPGPEAGAGIGALAMAGVAFLIRKRRRSLAA